MTFAAIGRKRRIYGVDFSGAKDAGRKIWISEGLAEEGEFLLLDCYPIYELVPGMSKERGICISSLLNLIISDTRSVFGIDSPFSLPDKLLSGKDWCSFVEDFPDNYSSPEDFRTAMRAIGGVNELKRLTDTEVKAPFSVYNLWVYKQTYYGIRDIVRPLLKAGDACILPMQEPLEDKPWLMEICPASTLKSEGLYMAYKGRSEKEKITRGYILEEMVNKCVTIPGHLKERMINNYDGDALDSFIAAYATFRSLARIDDIIGRLPDIYLREGYTFF
ncbi:MAG: hypothetical protein QCH31_01290 [Methanolobus sp.]|nr:hypothetical protein [Methanolobus sp.]